jgi:MinD-like ATPase involved in chromosome partitioning or flagellar assembly
MLEPSNAQAVSVSLRSRLGKTITFYSYKGGTGRSMALANVAWILASQGQKVLMVDWDLEAPGLHRYIRPFLDDPALTSCPGVIDLVIDYASKAKEYLSSSSRTQTGAELDGRTREWISSQAKILPYALPVFGGFESGGRLDFMPAGQQGPAYAERVNSFDWRSFYERLYGRAFLHAIRESFNEYDYILIDSRTGVSDTSGICTVDIPDVLVVCFTLNYQSLEGASAVAESARTLRESDNRQRLVVIPVPMRVESGEKDKLNRMRDLVERHFGPMVDDRSLELVVPNSATSSYQRVPSDSPFSGRESQPASFQPMPVDRDEVNERAKRVRRFFSLMEVPYEPYFAYEENLAAFADRPGGVNTVLASFERLSTVVTAGQISSLKPPTNEERDRVLRAFSGTSEELLLESPRMRASTPNAPFSWKRASPWQWLGIVAAVIAVILFNWFQSHPHAGPKAPSLIASYRSVAQSAVGNVAIAPTGKMLVALTLSGDELTSIYPFSNFEKNTFTSSKGALAIGIDPRTERPIVVSSNAIYNPNEKMLEEKLVAADINSAGQVVAITSSGSMLIPGTRGSDAKPLGSADSYLIKWDLKNDKRVVVGTTTGTISLYDLSFEREIRAYSNRGSSRVTALASDRGGDIVIAGFASGAAMVFSVSGEAATLVNVLNSISFVAIGRALAAIGAIDSGKVSLCNLGEPGAPNVSTRTTVQIDTKSNGVLSGSLSPDGKILVLGTQDGIIQVWSTGTPDDSGP